MYSVLPDPLRITSRKEVDGKLGTGTSLNSHSTWAAQVWLDSWHHGLEPYVLAIRGVHQKHAQKRCDSLSCSVGEIIFKTARQVLIKLAIKQAKSNMPWGCRDDKPVSRQMAKSLGGANSCNFTAFSRAAPFHVSCGSRPLQPGTGPAILTVLNFIQLGRSHCAGRQKLTLNSDS